MKLIQCKLKPEKGQRRVSAQCQQTLCFCLSSTTQAQDTLYIEDFCQSLKILAASANDSMETSKNRPVFNLVIFSSMFLSVICFAGLIRVEIELHVHRQMLQVLNQQREEKIEIQNTANDENECVMKMLHSDSNKGELERFY